MPQRDFHGAISEAKRQLDDGSDLSAAADRRLRARLDGEAPEERTSRSLRWARVSLAGAAAALLIVATWSLWQKPPAPPSSLAGFAVLTPSKDLSVSAPAGDTVRLLTGRCTLRDEALRSAITVTAPAALRRTADGVELQAGVVELDVEHEQPRAAPYRVHVSHGTIEVLGTRFTVAQRADGGEVTLHRGSVRFRADDAQVRLLTPGQSLAWPLPQVELPAPRLPDPVPPLSPTVAPPVKRGPLASTVSDARVVDSGEAPADVVVGRAFDPEELLNRIATLRSRGQYEEAVTVLAEALREGHSTSTNERLSFELGAILTRQLADRSRACAHWRRHQLGFPQGRYDREVTQASSQLACDD